MNIEVTVEGEDLAYLERRAGFRHQVLSSVVQEIIAADRIERERAVKEMKPRIMEKIAQLKREAGE